MCTTVFCNTPVCLTQGKNDSKIILSPSGHKHNYLKDDLWSANNSLTVTCIVIFRNHGSCPLPWYRLSYRWQGELHSYTWQVRNMYKIRTRKRKRLILYHVSSPSSFKALIIMFFFRDTRSAVGCIIDLDAICFWTRPSCGIVRCLLSLSPSF